ncbi:MAG TPA: carboxypeptidase-like regulatory domain-containing protein, partial [Allocoleopsis sp.]
MKTRLLSLLLIFVFFKINTAFSQNFTLSGYVKDLRSGETLIGVNIYNKAQTGQGASTNTYGFYSLTLPKGSYTFKVSYVGYADREIKVDLTENKQLNI